MASILTVLPASGGSRTVGENCVFALKQLGHSVDIFDIAQEKERCRNNSSGDALLLINADLITKIATSKWDILFVLALSPITIQTVRMAKSAGVITVHYFCEDLKTADLWQPIIAEYDFFFIIQRGEWLVKCRSYNKNSFYLPNGAPVENRLTNVPKKLYDISFAGAPYANRISFFEKLASLDINFFVFGWGWNKVNVSSKLRGKIKGQGNWLNSNEMFSIYSQSKIVLNLHSTLNSNEVDSEGDFVNPRAFTIPLAHSLQITDRRNSLFEFFTEGFDIVCFGSIDELVEKIHYYLAHPDAAEIIIAESINTVSQKHLLTYRMQDLMQSISANGRYGLQSQVKVIKQKLATGGKLDDKDLIVLLTEDIRIKKSSSEG